MATHTHTYTSKADDKVPTSSELRLANSWQHGQETAAAAAAGRERRDEPTLDLKIYVAAFMVITCSFGYTAVCWPVSECGQGVTVLDISRQTKLL